MADKAHRLTDEKLEEMEKRLSAIYSRAEKEIQKTTDEYFSKFAAQDKKKRTLLEQGKITEDEYKKWRKGTTAEAILKGGYDQGYEVGYDNGNQWWFDWIRSRRSVDSLFMEAPIETVPNGIDFSNATVASNLFRKCEKLKSVPMINTTNAQNVGYMFYYAKFAEPVEVTVDIRSAVNVSGLVANSAKIKRLNLIGDFSTVTTSNYMVQWASDLEEIHAYTDETLSVEIPLDMSNNTSANSMHYGNVLKYIRFVPGSIKVSQGFYDRGITEETKQSIVEGLADLTGLAPQTLTMSATLTDEQKAIVSDKNWTLVN